MGALDKSTVTVEYLTQWPLDSGRVRSAEGDHRVAWQNAIDRFGGYA